MIGSTRQRLDKEWKLSESLHEKDISRVKQRKDDRVWINSALKMSLIDAGMFLIVIYTLESGSSFRRRQSRWW